MVVAVRCILNLPEAADLRCRRLASKLNHRLAKISQIRGCYSPQTLVDQHRDLVFYPLVNQKPVQIQQDWCDVTQSAAPTSRLLQ